MESMFLDLGGKPESLVGVPQWPETRTLVLEVRGNCASPWLKFY